MRPLGPVLREDHTQMFERLDRDLRVLSTCSHFARGHPRFVRSAHRSRSLRSVNLANRIPMPEFARGHALRIQSQCTTRPSGMIFFRSFPLTGEDRQRRDRRSAELMQGPLPQERRVGSKQVRPSCVAPCRSIRILSLHQCAFRSYVRTTSIMVVVD